MGLMASLLGRGSKGAIEKEWAVSLGSRISSQIVTGYIDEESVVACTSTGVICALSSSGQLKWTFSTLTSVSRSDAFFLEGGGASSIKSTPVIADINQDGKGEVICGSQHGTLYALDCKGRLLWAFRAQDSINGSVCVADINNDRKPEILFGSNDGNLYALTSLGKLLWKFNAGSAIESHPVFSRDINQVIFGADNGSVYSLSGTGRKLWEFKTYAKITAQPVIGDLYGDGRKFIVAGSLDTNLYTIASDGKLEWFYKTEGKIFSKAVLADVNSDKKMEVIFGSCDDKLHVLSAFGNKIWDYETDFWIVASPLVSDFDGDNRLEVAIGSYDGFVYLLEAEGKYSLDYIPGISGITSQAGNYTDVALSEPGSYRGILLSKYKTEGTIVGQGILNGGKAMVAASDIGKIYKLKYKKD